MYNGCLLKIDRLKLKLRSCLCLQGWEKSRDKKIERMSRKTERKWDGKRRNNNGEMSSKQFRDEKEFLLLIVCRFMCSTVNNKGMIEEKEKLKKKTTQNAQQTPSLFTHTHKLFLSLSLSEISIYVLWHKCFFAILQHFNN